MPELPEVEAARRAVEENCLGKKIKRAVIANDPKVIDGVSHIDFQTSLVGKTIVSAQRKGKNLWLVLDSPPSPSFQFGMAGAIYIKGIAVTQYKRSAVKDSDEWPSKYSKFLVELDDGLEMSFTDKRRFARVRLLDDPCSVPPISELGPDALQDPMTLGEFEDKLKKKKIGIKALLLDQSFISGIGNWLADEVLYQAKIHPLEITSSMSTEQCAGLHKSIKEVIEKSLEVGANSGQFPCNWIFHSREKRPGKAFVDGKKIEFINAGGRTTAYVPDLQKLIGKDAAGGRGKGNSKKKTTGDDSKESEAEEIDDGKLSHPGVRVKKPEKKRKNAENDEGFREHENDDESESGSEYDTKTEKGMEAGRGSKSKTQPSWKRKGRKADDDADAEVNDHIDHEIYKDAEKNRGRKAHKGMKAGGRSMKHPSRNDDHDIRQMKSREKANAILTTGRSAVSQKKRGK